MTSELIKAFVTEINKTMICYYDGVPNTAVFPYAVIGDLSSTDLQYCELISIDVYLYQKEGVEFVLETLCDNLQKNLEGFILREPGKFNAHISFANRVINSEVDIELVSRKLIFDVRTFYM